MSLCDINPQFFSHLPQNIYDDDNGVKIAAFQVEIIQ